VLENNIFRKIFVSKEDEVSEQFIIIYNKGRHNSYRSPSDNETKRLRWAQHVARMRDTRNTYRIFIQTSVRERQIVRPRRG